MGRGGGGYERRRRLPRLKSTEIGLHERPRSLKFDLQLWSSSAATRTPRTASRRLSPYIGPPKVHRHPTSTAPSCRTGTTPSRTTPLPSSSRHSGPTSQEFGSRKQRRSSRSAASPEDTGYHSRNSIIAAFVLKSFHLHPLLNVL